MPERAVIEKKLHRILVYLQELRRVSFIDFEDFQKDIVKKRFVERNIELCIEAMIDVCRHLVSSLDLQEPESYAECFRILAGGSVIPEARQKTFAEMARFRNRLIHLYDDVDDTITFDIFSDRLTDFEDFVNVIRGYLRTLE